MSRSTRHFLNKINSRRGKPQTMLTLYFRLIYNRTTHKSFYVKCVPQAMMPGFLQSIHLPLIGGSILFWIVLSTLCKLLYKNMLSWICIHVISWAYKTLLVFFSTHFHLRILTFTAVWDLRWVGGEKKVL